MKRTALGVLIVIVAMATVAIFSGCVGGKISAIDDIITSSSLMNSGETRVAEIDLEAGAYSDAKIKLTAAKVDYQEALKILDNATTVFDAEKEIIELNKVICSYSLDSIAALQKFTVFMEHMDKVVAYMEGAVNVEPDDIALIRSELKLADDALDDTAPLISTAKEKCFSIDMDTVPIQSKSGILEDRLSLEQSEKLISEYGEMISGDYSLVDGVERMLEAAEYMEQEHWHTAQLWFGECSADLSKSRDIFMNLKNSEFAEISTSAIEIYVPLTEVLEAVDHLEAGCGYADRGDFSKAEKEFNEVLAFLEYF